MQVDNVICGGGGVFFQICENKSGDVTMMSRGAQFGFTESKFVIEGLNFKLGMKESSREVQALTCHWLPHGKWSSHFDL